jgi:hypothetical protein
VKDDGQCNLFILFFYPFSIFSPYHFLTYRPCSLSYLWQQNNSLPRSSISLYLSHSYPLPSILCILYPCLLIINSIVITALLIHITLENSSHSSRVPTNEHCTFPKYTESGSYLHEGASVVLLLMKKIIKYLT